MDPLAILGIATSIVAFIDFGTKVVSESLELYRSSDGLTDEHSRAQRHLDQLDRICAKLSQSDTATSLSQLTPGERDLCDVAAECAKTAKELRIKLQGLTVKPHNIKSAIGKSVKAAWKAEEIKNLEGRLKKISDLFHMHMSAVLLERQSGLCQCLESLSNERRRIHLDDQSKVDKFRKELVDLIEAMQRDSKEDMRILQEMSTAMQQKLLDVTRVVEQHGLLSSLRFPDMRDRVHEVAQNHANTFEWLFDDHHTKVDIYFKEWLRSASGVYWITGKPGSGKSTLMKSICRHTQTKGFLEEWAGGAHLITASFFFWNAGIELEKSQEGLLRSLIFEILIQCPEMISVVSAGQEDLHWNLTQTGPIRTHWSCYELLRMLKTLIQDVSRSRRFCFFIDGMDEYAGEDLEIARLLADIASMPNVKLCVSSRAHIDFERLFGEDPKFTLVLSDHTVQDIMRYTSEVLCANVDPDSATVYEALVKNITTKAQGVFLWVFLVVTKLANSINKGESLEEMRTRVTSFPQNLEVYFHKMLDSIEKEYWQSSAQILLICVEYRRPVQLWAFETVLPFPADPDRFEALYAWQKQAATRIRARCKDLLTTPQVEASEPWLYIARVGFEHRTIYDFLSSPDVVSKLLDRVGPFFDPCYATCVSLANAGRVMAEVEESTSLDYIILSIMQSANLFEQRTGSPACKALDRAHEILAPVIESIPNFDRPADIRKQAVVYGMLEYLKHVVKVDPTFAYMTSLELAFNISTLNGQDFPYGDIQPLLKNDVVILLLENGADPNAQRAFGSAWEKLMFELHRQIGKRPPFADQALCDRTELSMVITTLIRAGADLNYRKYFQPGRVEYQLTVDYPNGDYPDGLVISDGERFYSSVEGICRHHLKGRDAERVQLAIQERRRDQSKQITDYAHWTGWA